MRIADILEHFHSRADWLDIERTVDRVIVGDPDSDVDHCLVTWIPGSDAVRAAAERGVRLIICHEPTFWDHRDKVPEENPKCAAKLDLIALHGITIVRIHDSWDRWPEVGIPWAWAAFLGLDGPPAAMGSGGCQHRYDVEPVAFGTFAERVAARTAAIGEPLVEAAGDPAQTVSRIGIGTGCIVGVSVYEEMDCDCWILTDDGSSYWRDVQYAADLDVPVICVNHATSEEPGMVTLARYVNEHIEGVVAEHLPQGCRFRLVGARA